MPAAIDTQRIWEQTTESGHVWVTLDPDSGTDLTAVALRLGAGLAGAMTIAAAAAVGAIAIGVCVGNHVVTALLAIGSVALAPALAWLLRPSRSESAWYRIRLDQRGVHVDRVTPAPGVDPEQLFELPGASIARVPWDDLARVDRRGRALVLSRHSELPEHLPELPLKLAEALEAQLEAARARFDAAAASPELAAARRERLHALVREGASQEPRADARPLPDRSPVRPSSRRRGRPPVDLDRGGA